VTAAGEPIRVALSHTGAARPLLVAAFCRGRLVDQQLVTAKRPLTEVKLTPAAGTRGVVRLTVFEIAGKQLVPLAERLVYRLPAQRLLLEVQGDKQPYQPGQKVQLSVKTHNESGGPISAWLLAAVVDARALLPADREAVWGLPADFYLTSELHQPEDLEQADFLLREDGQAHKALDLFLGTHGWRRFVQSAPGKVLGDASRAVMLAEEQTPVLNYDNRPQAEKRLAESLGLAQDRLLADVRSRRLRLQEERAAHETSAGLVAQEFGNAEQTLRGATRDLEDYRAQAGQALRSAAGLLVLFLCGLGGLFLILGFVRLARRRPTTNYLATAFTSLLLCLVLAYALTHGAGAVGHKAPGPAGEADSPLAWHAAPELPALGKLDRGPGKESKEAPVVVFALRAAKADEKSTGAKADMMKAKESTGAKADMAKASDVPLGFGLSRRLEDRARAPFDLKKTVPTEELKKRMAQATTSQAKDPASVILEYHLKPEHTDLVPGVPSAKGGGAEGATYGGTYAFADSFFRRQLVREYAHQHVKGGVDSQETVLWHPALLAENGSITLPSFDLSDNATTYRVLLYGHTTDGRLGVYQGWLEAKK
jgi:hypothetical protein